MPTNILRHRPPLDRAAKRGSAAGGARRILITAGGVAIRAELTASSPTAARLAAALPLFSTAETWGDCLHFEVPIASGRERGARVLVRPGDVCFADGRIYLPFGRTPLSRTAGEVRLPRPCNLIACTLDALDGLKMVAPGEKVSVVAAPG